MRVVVPALRLAILFLNVYDTFKTLKHPPASRRDGGGPSARALYKRKRDMKGCLSVWIVWCCLAAYERMLDSVVGLVIPFHDEIKCFFMFFILVTRARGAEPIFLHVIRPLIRPHVATLDAILDIAYLFGNVLALIGSTPIRFVMEWRNYRVPRYGDSPEGYSTGPPSDVDPMPSTLPQQHSSPSGRRTRVATDPMLDRRRRSSQPRQVSDGSARNSRATFGGNHGSASRIDSSQREMPTNIAGQSPPRPSPNQTGRSYTAPSSATYTVWHPPPAAFVQDGLPPPEGLDQGPTNALSEESPSTPPQAQHLTVDEWRLYPPFPAAYPPTPLPVSSTLPLGSVPASVSAFNPIAESQEEGASSGNAQHLSVEEWRLYPPFPSAYPPTPLPIASSLPSESGTTHSSRFPSIAEGREEGDTTPPSQDCQSRDTTSERGSLPFDARGSSKYMSLDTDANDGDKEDEDEDEFNVTLRTPTWAASRQNHLHGRTIRVSSPSERSRSTTLTTAMYNSAMRSSSFSESSDSSSVSDSSLSVRHHLSPPVTSEFGQTEGSAPPSSSSTASTRPKAATWSPATRRTEARAMAAESTDSESVGVPREGNATGGSRNAQSQRGKLTKARGRTAPAAVPVRTSTRLAASRTSSQDSGTSTNTGRSALPRNARGRK